MTPYVFGLAVRPHETEEGQVNRRSLIFVLVALIAIGIAVWGTRTPSTSGGGSLVVPAPRLRSAPIDGVERLERVTSSLSQPKGDARADGTASSSEAIRWSPDRIVDFTEFATPPVRVTCDVGALMTSGWAIYDTFELLRTEEGLNLGSMPALVSDGHVRLPALSGQDRADVFFVGVGMVRMTWPAIDEGDATCAETRLVADAATVEGVVTDANGEPVADVKLSGCGGVAQSDAAGRYSLSVATSEGCEVRLVKYEGQRVPTDWGPTYAIRADPGETLVVDLEWEALAPPAN